MVSLQVDHAYSLTERQATVDQTLNYVGVAVAVMGTVMAVYGFMMPTRLVWSRERWTRWSNDMVRVTTTYDSEEADDHGKKTLNVLL
jgi:rRNA processing protein Gar1